MIAVFVMLLSVLLMQHRPEVVPEFYFASELETLTGVPQTTYRYWASTGQGPRSFLIGRRRVWPRAEFRAWLAEQSAKSA